MKSAPVAIVSCKLSSLLSRGAWIEIAGLTTFKTASKSLLSRGAWIEIIYLFALKNFPRSLLSRGAWIEIVNPSEYLKNLYRRSSHEERGLKSGDYDKNNPRTGRSSHEERGLKSHHTLQKFRYLLSLLSRGAWIEISSVFTVAIVSFCRSSHEERGLKLGMCMNAENRKPSLLSRGAWIEIVFLCFLCKKACGRSSHEERGLKSVNIETID